MTTPILHTQRLTLRPLKVSDAAHIFISWGSDENVSKYVRWTTHKTQQETKQWLLAEQNSVDDDNYTWGFELKSTGKLIGSGGIVFNNQKKCYELGYNLMQAEWGKGFAFEASKKILEFAKTNLHQNQIYCCHALENLASQSVINKLGFKYCGNSHYTKFDGTSCECKEYYLNLV